MTNTDIINKYLEIFNANLKEGVTKIIKNIKSQYGFDELFYTLDEAIVISDILNEVHIIIDSKKNVDIINNRIHININPFKLNINKLNYDPPVINMLNKNIWVLIYT